MQQRVSVSADMGPGIYGDAYELPRDLKLRMVARYAALRLGACARGFA
jgi:hypothetical protein